MKGDAAGALRFPTAVWGARHRRGFIKVCTCVREEEGPPAHSGHFPLARSRSHLLKANITLGQGGSAEKWQPGHPHSVSCLFFLTL